MKNSLFWSRDSGRSRLKETPKKANAYMILLAAFARSLCFFFLSDDNHNTTSHEFCKAVCLSFEISAIEYDFVHLFLLPVWSRVTDTSSFHYWWVKRKADIQWNYMNTFWGQIFCMSLWSCQSQTYFHGIYQSKQHPIYCYRMLCTWNISCIVCIFRHWHM